MVVIGLTGGVGSGKSTVAAYFKRLGARVVDVDVQGQRLLWRNSPCFARLVKTFGRSILTRGRINRQKLGQVVFADRRKLKQLERIVHPVLVKRVKAAVKKFKKSQSLKAAVIDAALLYKLKLHYLSDIVIVVQASEKAQVQRAMKRLRLSKEEIKRRIQVQLPSARKVPQSDYVIKNSGTLIRTKQQVEKIWRDIV